MFLMTTDEASNEGRCVIPWCRRPRAAEGEYCPDCASAVPLSVRKEDDEE